MSDFGLPFENVLKEGLWLRLRNIASVIVGVLDRRILSKVVGVPPRLVGVPLRLLGSSGLVGVAGALCRL